MFEQAGKHFPTGRNWFKSVDAAKKDAEQSFRIRETDWVEQPGTPKFATEFESAAAEAIKKYSEAATKRPPIDYVKHNELLMRSFTPAQGRRFKKLLPGKWLWEDHELTISDNGTWTLACPTEVRLPRFPSLSATKGNWSYSSGSVNFRAPNVRTGGFKCSIVCILELDDEQFIFHAAPKPVTLSRYQEQEYPA